MRFLRHKSDAYEAIESFVCMGRTQFNKKVQVIRSDNALEFDDKKCKPFFAKLGTILKQHVLIDLRRMEERKESIGTSWRWQGPSDFRVVYHCNIGVTV